MPYCDTFWDRHGDWIKFIVLTVGVLGGLTVFLYAVGWWCAYEEAKAYYRVTGVRVSTEDAMHLDLRVVSPPLPSYSPESK